MTTKINSVKQHSLFHSLVLHLLPGILIGCAYFVLRPFFLNMGYPSVMALMCTIPLILIPIELGYLLYEGRKRNGRISLEGVVLYRTKIPLIQYILWGSVVFVLMGIIFTLMKPVDVLLQQQVFPWVPSMESGLQKGYSQATLIVTYVMVSLFGVFVGPVVEELYFRGFLLPRMGYAGKWAPLIHSFLFGIYHIWTPWMFLTRTLGLLPLVHVVQRRNIYLGIMVHILVNVIDVIAGVSFILTMSRHT